MRRNVLAGIREEKVDNISKKYRMKNKIVASLALFSRKDARGMRRNNQSTVSHTGEDLHFRGHAREFARFQPRLWPSVNFEREKYCFASPLKNIN